jgi:HNH endonuclease
LVRKRKAIPPDIRHIVLHESGYRCGNPVCRHVLTLDIHHLVCVSEGGSDASENLLPPCPNCHALHHKSVIPLASLRTWKMLLLSLNEAFDRKAIDILLLLDRLGSVGHMTGDGLIVLASLVASGLIEVSQYLHITTGSTSQSESFSILRQTIGSTSQFEQMYRVELSKKGKLFVEGWKKGDQSSALLLQTEK